MMSQLARRKLLKSRAPLYVRELPSLLFSKPQVDHCDAHPPSVVHFPRENWRGRLDWNLARYLKVRRGPILPWQSCMSCSTSFCRALSASQGYRAQTLRHILGYRKLPWSLQKGGVFYLGFHVSLPGFGVVWISGRWRSCQVWSPTDKVQPVVDINTTYISYQLLVAQKLIADFLKEIKCIFNKT